MSLPIHSECLLDDHERRMAAELGRDDVSALVMQCRVELLLHRLTTERAAIQLQGVAS